MIGVDDPRVTAMLDLLRRTGATQIQARYSDDETPTIWFFVAVYGPGRFETAAAGDPARALERLCSQVVDGGQCAHCGCVAGFDLDSDDTYNRIVAPGVCWFMWDPELKTIRRSCEGDTK